MKLTTRIAPTLLLTTCLASLAGPAGAGTGSIEGGQLDLLVYFSYEEPDPQSWEPAFDELSELLANATEGGLALGTVSFTRSPDLKSRADVWIDDSTDGARSHLLGLGATGRHVFLTQTHKVIGGDVPGPYGMLHALSHYLWGCLDGSGGVVGYAEEAHPGHSCTESESGIACPMDGNLPESGVYGRTEFCTQAGLGFEDTEHSLGVNSDDGRAVRTFQEYVHAKSCWELIEESGVGGLVHPTTQPALTAPATLPVIYDYGRLTGDLAVAMIVDRSGSMQFQNLMQLAIDGVHSGIGLMKGGQHLSVTAFNNQPQTQFPMTTLDAASQQAAIAAVSQLFPQGGTGIGQAVFHGLGQLNQVQAGSEILILLTDGESTTAPRGDDPAVLSALQSSGAVAFCIGLGQQANERELIAMVEATGGRFFKVLDGRELPSIFHQIFTEVTGGTALVESVGEDIDALETVTETFEVSALSSAARVSLAYAQGANMGLILTAPDGGTLDFQSAAAAGIGVETPVSKTVTIDDPQEGVWTATIVNSTAQAQTYDFLAFVESKTLEITLKDAGDAVFPEPMCVSVALVAGLPVRDASVDAIVTRPDGSTLPITLFDDGLAVHGDQVPGDGIFSALFSEYVANGDYTFDLTIDATDARPMSNASCGVFGDVAIPRQIDAFTGGVATTLSLSGMAGLPAAGSANLEAHVDTVTPVVVRESAPTPVASFSLATAADEAVVLEALRMAVTVIRGEASGLEGLALHLDRDGDGEVDRPSIPLAIGRMDSDDELIFDAIGGALARLAAGETHHFLVTAGEALPREAPEEEVIESRAGGPGAAAALAGSMQDVSRLGGPIVAALLAVGLVAYSLARRDRETSLRQGLERGVARAVIASVFVVGAGCHRSGGHHAKHKAASSYELTLEASGVQMRGAVTGDEAGIDGDAQTYAFELE